MGRMGLRWNWSCDEDWGVEMEWEMNGDVGYREDLDSDTKGVYRVMSGWASVDSSTDRQPRNI